VRDWSAASTLPSLVQGNRRLPALQYRKCHQPLLPISSAGMGCSTTPDGVGHQALQGHSWWWLGRAGGGAHTFTAAAPSPPAPAKASTPDISWVKPYEMIPFNQGNRTSTREMAKSLGETQNIQFTQGFFDSGTSSRAVRQTGNCQPLRFLTSAKIEDFRNFVTCHVASGSIETGWGPPPWLRRTGEHHFSRRIHAVGPTLGQNARGAHGPTSRLCLSATPAAAGMQLSLAHQGATSHPHWRSSILQQRGQLPSSPPRPFQHQLWDGAAATKQGQHGRYRSLAPPFLVVVVFLINSPRGVAQRWALHWVGSCRKHDFGGGRGTAATLLRCTLLRWLLTSTPRDNRASPVTNTEFPISQECRQPAERSSAKLGCGPAYGVCVWVCMCIVRGSLLLRVCWSRRPQPTRAARISPLLLGFWGAAPV
jgi:hypothetical protein